MFRIDLDRIRERGHGPDVYRTAAVKAKEQAVVWEERGRQDNAEYERKLAERWLEIADLLEAEG
jgi:hypothetical protein